MLFDDVQYTRRDWRNRNRIKTPHGPAWLTIPVQVSGNYLTAIKDIVVSDPDWGKKHWRTLTGCYAKAPFFRTYAETFERLYLDTHETHLSRINRTWIEAVCEALSIRTRLSWSMDYCVAAGQNERLVSICHQLGADTYLSGPSASAYLDAAVFRAGGVALEYIDYAGYPEYEQLYPPFDHAVSVLDLLFHTGPRAAAHLDRG